MALFNRNSKPTLFPNRQTLASTAWTVTSDIAKEMRADSREILVIRDADGLTEKIKRELENVKPAIKIYFFNGCFCYLPKDEQRLYDLIEEIKSRQQQKPVWEERKHNNNELFDMMQTADKARQEQKQPHPDFLAKMGLSDEPDDEIEDEPTDVENRWSEEILTSQLAEIEEEIKDTEKLLSASEPAEDGKKQDTRKKRKSLGRKNQIMTRLTDSELVKFQRRVKKTGLPQGEYLREAALNGRIVIEEKSMADVALLDELALIRAELGRQGGLLKMVIKPNQGQRELSPGEWAELISAVKDLDDMKKTISRLEVKVNGNRETHSIEKREL